MKNFEELFNDVFHGISKKQQIDQRKEISKHILKELTSEEKELIEQSVNELPIDIKFKRF